MNDESHQTPLVELEDKKRSETRGARAGICLPDQQPRQPGVHLWENPDPYYGVGGRRGWDALPAPAEPLTEMIIHALKTWPEFFEQVVSGAKTFEIRRDDRSFKVGEVLELREFDPRGARFTGRSVWRKLTYITNWEQKSGYVVMAIERTDKL
jgi:hypothetical protein